MGDLTFLEDHAAIRPQLEKALEACGKLVARGAVVEIAGERAAWVDTGLDLIAGRQISLLSRGVAWWAKPLGIGVEGRVSLWYRIGEAPIAKAIDNTATFTAGRSGRLFLINRWFGEWSDESGNFDAAHPHRPVEGGFTVAVIVWRGGAADGLARLAQEDSSGLAAEELTRLRQERPEPRGWSALWRLGRTGIYGEAADGAARHIACRCRADAGILKYPVDAPLDEDTRLAWRWRMRTLPSEVAEDTLPTHDYLSIAVEFENGQDLTYFWSAALPVGHWFRCPLPWWDQHETHLVVRSGGEGLGHWADEEVPVLADYRRTVGGEPPRRIVGVWLIAVSAFQRRTGACDYGGIRLSGRDWQTVIGP